MKEIIHAIECVRQIKQTANELTPDIIKVLKHAKKEHELLEVYRKREINRNLPHPSHADEIIYTRKIDKLESELND